MRSHPTAVGAFDETTATILSVLTEFDTAMAAITGLDAQQRQAPLADQAGRQRPLAIGGNRGVGGSGLPFASGMSVPCLWGYPRSARSARIGGAESSRSYWEVG